MSVSGVERFAPAHAMQGAQVRRPDFMAKLAADDSTEAKALKEALEGLKSQREGGGGDATALKAAESKALTAMDAYLEHNPPPEGAGRPKPPPPRPELMQALASDDSDEASALKKAFEALKAHREAGADATTMKSDHQALRDAMDAYAEKLSQATSGSGGLYGQGSQSSGAAIASGLLVNAWR